jgi:hypothetical protein
MWHFTTIYAGLDARRFAAARDLGRTCPFLSRGAEEPLSRSHRAKNNAAKILPGKIHPRTRVRVAPGAPPSWWNLPPYGVISLARDLGRDVRRETASVYLTASPIAVCVSSSVGTACCSFSLNPRFRSGLSPRPRVLPGTALERCPHCRKPIGDNPANDRPPAP